VYTVALLQSDKLHRLHRLLRMYKSAQMCIIFTLDALYARSSVLKCTGCTTLCPLTHVLSLITLNESQLLLWSTQCAHWMCSEVHTFVRCAFWCTFFVWLLYSSQCAQCAKCAKQHTFVRRAIWCTFEINYSKVQGAHVAQPQLHRVLKMYKGALWCLMCALLNTKMRRYCK
jgi:hypothetical protein